MNTLAYLLLLAPAALAGLVNPLQERETTCEYPLSPCGDKCIHPLDICCPAAPNGQIIACGSTDNCWIAPDNSPGCCPLFHDCAGQKAGSGVFPTLPSVTLPSSTPIEPSVSIPPTISTQPPQQTTTASTRTISRLSSVTPPPSSARCTSTKPTMTSTPCAKPTATGTSSGSGSDSGSGSGSSAPASSSPVFNGASSSGAISIGGILGAMALGFFL